MHMLQTCGWGQKHLPGDPLDKAPISNMTILFFKEFCKRTRGPHAHR